jgi:cysteine desulfurase
VRKLRDRMEAEILRRIPHSVRNGDRDSRLPNTSNVSFDGVEAGDVLKALDHAGICASSGSACTTGSLEPSHVLMAMGMSAARARGSLRFSLGIYNNEADVDFLLEQLPPIIGKLRGNKEHAPKKQPG